MSKETITCTCGGTMHQSDDMENPFAGPDDRRPFFQCEDCGEIVESAGGELWPGVPAVEIKR